MSDDLNNVVDAEDGIQAPVDGYQWLLCCCKKRKFFSN